MPSVSSSKLDLPLPQTDVPLGITMSFLIEFTFRSTTSSWWHILFGIGLNGLGFPYLGTARTLPKSLFRKHICTSSSDFTESQPNKVLDIRRSAWYMTCLFAGSISGCSRYSWSGYHLAQDTSVVLADLQYHCTISGPIFRHDRTPQSCCMVYPFSTNHSCSSLQQTVHKKFTQIFK